MAINLRGMAEHMVSAAVGGLIVAGVMVMNMPQSGQVQPIVRAKEFQLIGPDGKERGSWDINKEGTASLGLLHDAGAVLITAGKNGRAMVLGTDNGANVLLDSNDKGASVVAFGNDKLMSRLCVDGDEPYVRVTGSQKASISVADSNGATRAVVGHAATVNINSGIDVSEPLSTVTLFDETGKVHWQSP